MAETTIYTKPGCPYCAALKRDLDGRGIEYKEIDVTASAEALEELRRVSGDSRVPVTVRGGEVTIGFGGA